MSSDRSEEHTSELQSLRHLVCRLLLEKKKTQATTPLVATSTPPRLDRGRAFPLRSALGQQPKESTRSRAGRTPVPRILLFFFLKIRPPPRSTLFPYPTLFRSVRNHPRFKYFAEAGEDPYQSFLGVPLIDRGVLQGVLVVQTVEARAFPENEIRLLAEAAKRVAPVVSEARTLDRFIAPVQERLWALARNLWWSWDHDSAQLFRDLDPQRWSQLNHSPISLLNEFPLAKLEARATELGLHSRINYAYRRLREYQETEHTWGARRAGVLRPRPVAYFSAEFGVHESLPVYSGGLGVLAGDHIKSASDLGIPLVGVGLFY